ncbi:NADH-quinone oxidoreductase subunit J [Salinibacillus xinjiangensis]|uniref:NADH-quinone oxidoreductase subunit J n=1 Tax=Salinibacillus xinjiangensis TaxID=1229268 RepID=A0A6G1X5K0_9BACI|nr:NADH-quinone oxidoreductase subunit J [Salinibacillus xinjiangensis]MRG86185.1 NADH-quinone oxidoreductase subunit J [Salinibacillus xinjiangensis]
MNGEFIAFLILSFTAILGGILMLNLKKVVHMLLSVVLTFVSLAGIYVLLSAEFVAVVQILIYSGAVTIILAFGIMLTKHTARDERTSNRLRAALVGVGVLVFFFTVYGAIDNLFFGPGAEGLHVENTQQIGERIFAHYVIPFELVSIVLLVALMGAIVLARKEGEENK